jgi:starch synthase
MKVLITASECAPLVKVGGIADVIGSLPIVLLEQGIDIRVVIPYYKPLAEKFSADTNGAPQKVAERVIPYGGKSLLVNVYLTNLPGTHVPIYLIENHDYISNGGIYYSPEYMPSPEGEIERFAFFSKAVADIFSEGPNGDPNQIFQPEIIHCNDWHTGMIPQIIQSKGKFIGKSAVKTIFTIHNLAYQGFSRLEVGEKLGLNIKTDRTLNWDAEDDNLDFVLQGIVGSDFVNTVSEKYAEEIQTPEYGEGLEEILKARGARLTGVLNGISYEIFNPMNDQYIKVKYTVVDYKTGKANNKTLLQQELGLEVNPDKPMLGIISRLAHQKGLDLVAESVRPIIEMGYQIVLLGTGDPFIETKFKEFNDSDLKDNFRALITFSEETARKIYASADMFLVPSRFEPCGLTQMIAMKYGAVPVVRATGGLYDTVQNEQTGFTYEQLNSEAMLQALRAAINVYLSDKNKWHKLVSSCMLQDFSWKESAKKYISLYRKVLSL